MPEHSLTKTYIYINVVKQITYIFKNVYAENCLERGTRQRSCCQSVVVFAQNRGASNPYQRMRPDGPRWNLMIINISVCVCVFVYFSVLIIQRAQAALRFVSRDANQLIKTRSQIHTRHTIADTYRLRLGRRWLCYQVTAVFLRHLN